MTELKMTKNVYEQRAMALAVEAWCAGQNPDDLPPLPKSLPEQPAASSVVTAEIERIEMMIVDALNALHRLRRNGATKVTTEQPEWISIAEAAFRLEVSETTAWRHATRCGANWADSGLRTVDFTRLKRVRPPRE